MGRHARGKGHGGILGGIAWSAIQVVLPRWYRNRYAEQLFAHHLERSGGRGARFWVRLASDAVLTGLAARWSTSERRRHRGAVSPGDRRPNPCPPGVADSIERILSDLRLAARNLVRNPVFSVPAALTLAVGIGANTAVFSIVHGVLMQPLPYSDPEELVYLRGTRGGEIRGTMAYPNLIDLRDASTSLRITMFTGSTATLLGHGPARQLYGGLVGANYFDVIGARPAVGRFFVADDEVEGRGRRIVLSHETWVGVFDGDPGIVGATITLDNEPALVVGVAEPGFVDPYNATMDYWATPAPDRSRSGRSYNGFARLAAGATIEQAQEETSTLMAALEEAYPGHNDGRSAVLQGAREFTVGPARPTLLVFSAAVGLVLLVVCANVANLFLGRATARGRDLALRRALGAGHAALLQQLAAESVLLLVVGGAVGVAAASAGTRAIVGLAADQLPRGAEVGLNLPVLGFAVTVSVISAILFGLAPALLSGRGDMAATLRSAGGHGGVSPSAHQARHLLVVAEIALTMILLVGAGLLLKSLDKLMTMEMGVNPENVLTFRIAPSAERHPEGEPLDRFFREVLAGIDAHPDVVASGASWAVPIAGWGNATQWLARPDGFMPAGVDEIRGQERAVTPGYFDAAGMRIVRGRGFRDADTGNAEPVVVISESFARRYFPDVDALGQTLIVRDNPRRIVGTLADVRQGGLGRDVEPGFWIPHAQESQDWLRRSSAVLVRTAADPANVADHARDVVREIDDTIPITDVRPMETFLVAQSRLWRLRATLLTAAAGVALFLACVGIVGIMSYTVQRRVPEIGVRMALGARPGDVALRVLTHGMVLSLTGLAIGTAGALALGRFLSGMLVDVEPSDPMTLLTTAGLLTAVALAASWLPAWRASRVDPLEALRRD